MWRIGRLFSGVGAMVLVGAIVDQYHRGESIGEPLAGFIAIFAAWAFAEYKADHTVENIDSLHPHDVALGLRLRQLFDEPTKVFLREHSFGSPYLHTRLHGVRDVSYWEGSEYEFENSELDNLASEIVRLSDELYAKLAAYAGPIDRPPGYFAVPLDHERIQDRFGPETTERIREVNALARQIVQQLDRFEKTFRKLSPESYVPGGQALIMTA